MLISLSCLSLNLYPVWIQISILSDTSMVFLRLSREDRILKYESSFSFDVVSSSSFPNHFNLWGVQIVKFR